MVLQKAIQNGVSNGRIPNPGMPMFYRQLAGNDRGFVAGAVIDDLQQVGARHAVDGSHTPVIQEQYIGSGQLNEPFTEGAAAMPNAQFFLQTRDALVNRRVTSSASMLGQRAAQTSQTRGQSAKGDDPVFAETVAQGSINHLGQATDRAPIK